MMFGQKARATVAAVGRVDATAIRWLSSQSSLGNGGLAVLVISSAIFLIYFVQPASIINQKERPDVTTEHQPLRSASDLTPRWLIQEKLILEDSLKVCREETKRLSETENENRRQSEATLTATLDLCGEQPKPERKQRQRPGQSDKGVQRGTNVTDTIVTINRAFFNYMAAYMQNTSYPGVEHYSRYAAARLGLTPLNDAAQLRPEFGAVVNDVLSFDYPISVAICRQWRANRTVFVAINSAPDNFERRDAIRKSWSNDLKTVTDPTSMGGAGFAFILGRTEDNSTQRRVEQESHTYGDILQMAMSDFYRNLSLKVAGLFNWLYRHCGKVDFVLKVDDDVYVNVRRLADFLQRHQPSDPSMFGTSAGGFTVNRIGKWSITFEEWPWKHYPPYFFGPAVLISASAIVPLLAAMQTTPMMPFDDVYYTAMCAERAGVRLHFSSNENSVLAMRPPAYCALHRVIAWITNNQTLSHLTAKAFYQDTGSNCTANDVNG